MSDRQALVCMQSVQPHVVASAEGGSDAAALEAVAQLPPLVLQALAHVLNYVQALVGMQFVQPDMVVSAEAGSDAAALKAVAQLPTLVLQALAHVLDYVRPLKMDAVLRLGASFKEFHGVHQMSLSPNALRWLHFLHCKACGQCLKCYKACAILHGVQTCEYRLFTLT